MHYNTTIHLVFQKDHVVLKGFKLSHRSVRFSIDKITEDQFRQTLKIQSDQILYFISLVYFAQNLVTRYLEWSGGGERTRGFRHFSRFRPSREEDN